MNWNCTKQEFETIVKIAQRAVNMMPHLEQRTILMDLNACHSNGCPLRLQELLTAPRFDFTHDIAGIYRHLNRETGQLEDCFVPRYAVRQ